MKIVFIKNNKQLVLLLLLLLGHITAVAGDSGLLQQME